MKDRHIFEALILNPASKTKDNWRFLMIRPENADKPDYLTTDASLEALVMKAKTEDAFVNIQFPEKRGILFDKSNNITYHYLAVSPDEQGKLSSKLAKYTKP